MAHILGFIILIVITILVGNDAEKRGMSGFGWGAGVFFLMIIFLPLYFIVRKPLL